MQESNTTELLLDVYCRLLDRYGPQSWWPAQTPFEVMVGAILTQAAAWSNVEKAIANLAGANALTPGAIRRLNEADLAQLVYPSGYYNVKARKLKALAKFLGDRHSDDIDEMARGQTGALRTELLAVYGIGDETADDIMLYALQHPIFVIDAYTRRLLDRLELLPMSNSTYSACQAFFMDNLNPDVRMFNEYHALIVRHCVVHCKKRAECEGCALLRSCPAGQRNRVEQATSSS